jgi:hypothetical protein
MKYQKDLEAAMSKVDKKAETKFEKKLMEIKM